MAHSQSHFTTTMNTKPTTYTVTHANGEVCTINSKRTLTHAVVIYKTPAHWAYEIRRIDTELSYWVNSTGPWAEEVIAKNNALRAEMQRNIENNFTQVYVCGWSASASNAATLAKQKANMFTGCNFTIVPVSR